MNEAFFLGQRSPPFYNSTFTEPYQAFVNHNQVDPAGLFVWANYFENSGQLALNPDSTISETTATISASSGSLLFQSTTNYSVNGNYNASSDVTISSANAVMINQNIPGRRAADA